MQKGIRELQVMKVGSGFQIDLGCEGGAWEGREEEEEEEKKGMDARGVVEPFYRGWLVG